MANFFGGFNTTKSAIKDIINASVGCFEFSTNKFGEVRGFYSTFGQNIETIHFHLHLIYLMGKIYHNCIVIIKVV